MRDLLELLWGCAGRNLLEATLWLGGGGLVGLLAGCAAAWSGHRWLIRGGWVDTAPWLDRVVRPAVLALWVVGLPLLGLTSGLLAGLAVESRTFLARDPLIEQAGRWAFQGGVSWLVAAAEVPEAPRSEQLDRARRYLSGEERIPVQELDRLRALPARMEEVPWEATLGQLLAGEEPPLSGLGRWVARQTLGAWLRASAERRLEELRPVLADLRDRGELSGGSVLAEALALAWVRVHLQPRLGRLVFDLIMAQLIPLAAIAAGLVASPVALARLGAWLVRVVARRPGGEARRLESPGAGAP